MRALERLGVFHECLAHGYGTHEVQMFDVNGGSLAVIPLPSALGSDLPGVMGMMRPTLHRILIDRATSQGIAIRTGLSPDVVSDHQDGVTVSFSDGSVGEYDLVVGADGLHSTIREIVSGPITATFQRQVCYRAVVPRPESVTREIVFAGCERVHIGFTPTGEQSMYLYCLVPAEDTTRPAEADLPEIVRGHLAPFGGIVADLREQITDPSRLNFTTLETLIAPEPWHRGRTVLVGDSAHSTTPHIAAGAAMCLEDALVLAEEIGDAETIPDALRAYSKRRFDRCRYVVETSAQLGYWQTHPETPGADPGGLLSAALGVLAGAF
jgi:2-polyprenyl-6-methoxyphenol hydroxylase-like FAD-dependent oxidoreductase